jgi:hypothetical protein
VNEPLEEECTLFAAHQLPIKVEFDDIFGDDQFRGDRARDQKMPRIF